MKELVKLISPKSVSTWVDHYAIIIAICGWLMLVAGCVWGIYYVPSDAQQGEVFRIIYIHVPAAIASLGLYSLMAITSLIYLVWGIGVAEAVSYAAARLGITWTAIALITGMIWGLPTWGTAWIWDARLTSELVLLFLYAGIIAITNLVPGPVRASKLAALVTIIGSIDIPIVHFSVKWWNTLHQGATVLQFSQPKMAPIMLYPLMLTIVATGLICIAWLAWLFQVRIWERNPHKQWVHKRLRLVAHNLTTQDQGVTSPGDNTKVKMIAHNARNKVINQESSSSTIFQDKVQLKSERYKMGEVSVTQDASNKINAQKAERQTGDNNDS